MLDDLLAEMQAELSEAYLEQVKDYRLPRDAAKGEFFAYSAEQGLAYEKITCAAGAYSQTRQEMKGRF